MLPSFFGHERCMDTVLQTSGRSRVKAVRKNSKDDYDKVGLPTGSSFIEDFLKVSARHLITDAEFGRSGPKCLSCDEMKCQSGLSWRQAKVSSQAINGLVHNKVRDDLRRHHCKCRSFVAVPRSPDLLLCAKDLFIAAMDGKSPDHTGIRAAGRGKLKQSRLRGRVRPFPLCKPQGRTLLKWRRRRPATCSSAPKICSLKPLRLASHATLLARLPLQQSNLSRHRASPFPHLRKATSFT